MAAAHAKPAATGTGAPAPSATAADPLSAPAAATTAAPTAPVDDTAAAELTAASTAVPTATATSTAPAAAPADAAAPAAAAAASKITDLDTDEGLAARLQADALSHAQRVEEHRKLQAEHPHMSMAAGYLKNLAETFNPKADTAPVPSYASGPKPALPARPTGPTTHTTPAPLPVMAGFAVNKGMTDQQLAASETGLRPDHPQRQGSSATASAIEELQSGVEALVSAHINKSRHVAGLPLVPVLLNGPADNLPAITSAAGLETMDDASLAGWAAYYLGESEPVDLDRATMIKAVQAGVGIPYA